jgi:hypothetical protein
LNLINFAILFLISFNSYALTLEEERKYDELEGVAFIKALVNDKKYDEVIKQFLSASRKTDQKGELYYYLAESYFALKDYTNAHEVLYKAEKFNQTPELYALWGKNYNYLKKYQSCSGAYDKVPKANFPSDHWSYYFDCLLRANKVKEALMLALNNQIKDPDFFILSQRILLGHALLRNAQEKRELYFNKCQDIHFYLRLWQEMENSKSTDMAVLEAAHACHPTAMEITGILIKQLFQLRHFHTIAFLFEELSANDQEYIKHTAEFYRVAGRADVSEYFFILGKEQDYFLSRSTYFLAQENYAALLSIPFKAEALISNKDLSYAVAYSNFKYLNLKASELTLGLTPNKTSRDKQLENLLEQCRELDWRCRP